ncbi:hypothetical protein SBY92_004029 [Candida maltosa Xu316]
MPPRPNTRKRKKNTINDGYKPQPYQQPVQLQLTPTPPINPPLPIEDDKLINHILKITPRRDIKEKSTFITVLLTLSEADKILEQKEKMINTFGVKDFMASEPVSGSIDQFLTIYGNPVEISRCLLYIIYFLNVKCFINYDMFTFKTSNFKITLLLKHSDYITDQLKYIDVAKYKSNIDSVFIQGDFISIFNFVLNAIDEEKNVDNSEIVNDPIFGLHVDTALRERSKENTEVINKANKKLLEYLYSSTSKLSS